MMLAPCVILMFFVLLASAERAEKSQMGPKSSNIDHKAIQLHHSEEIHTKRECTEAAKDAIDAVWNNARTVETTSADPIMVEQAKRIIFDCRQFNGPDTNGEETGSDNSRYVAMFVKSLQQRLVAIGWEVPDDQAPVPDNRLSHYVCDDPQGTWSGYTTSDKRKIYFSQLKGNCKFQGAPNNQQAANTEIGQGSCFGSEAKKAEVVGKRIMEVAHKIKTNALPQDILPVKIGFHVDHQKWVSINNRGYTTYTLAGKAPLRLLPVMIKPDKLRPPLYDLNEPGETIYLENNDPCSAADIQAFNVNAQLGGIPVGCFCKVPMNENFPFN